MNNKQKISDILMKVEKLVIVRAVRGGLTNLIPVLTIGAFALILNTFPVKPYQDFINSFAGGFLPSLFEMVNKATFGVLSIYMSFSISYAYVKLKADPETSFIGAASASVASFFILAGAYLPDFSTDRTGPKSMFLAILTGLGASALYMVFERLLRKTRRRVLTAGADKEFNKILSTLLPIAIVVVIFALFNAFVTKIFKVDSFHELLGSAFEAMFSIGSVGYFKGFCFVLLSSVLWFFGIHGSDTLEGVMQKYFAPGLAVNQVAVAAGNEPTQILTKEFFDCFVLMGGCGSAICLLIAILLFSKNRARKGLGITAAFPMIFNINELMVFGLPIIFNPVMLVPFLLTPLACYSVTYLAMSAGWVPLITSQVEWTTPILIGGYHATGSVAGLILQLVNVIIGVLIYLPFVKILDQRSLESAKSRFIEFSDFFRQHEQELITTRLTERSDMYGDLAKELCAEIRHEMESRFALAYQPQYSYDGKCVGVEALLRWRHPVHGVIYPPLVVKLADEGGFLPQLEELAIKRAIAERPYVLEKFGPDVKLSVNVTGITIITHRFVDFCAQLQKTYPIEDMNICLEVTEQAALQLNKEAGKMLRSLHDMGFMLAIDDFSMGQTSIHYMKDNMFDIIKLDGSLVRGLFDHTNTREIILSVSNLAASLGMQIIAEYVETKEQREALHELGCECYQGYLYSPAVFLEEKTDIKKKN
ncbi:MAG: PTS sugar transporter subunit IIC/EAL domain-containing protein [Clostridia bacterium]|nr:PTS sugar transporter subunit IIC/EAL domain-containing protein [Clostridia bacterium]